MRPLSMITLLPLLPLLFGVAEVMAATNIDHQPARDTLAADLFRLDEQQGASPLPPGRKLDMLFADDIRVPTRQGDFARGRQPALAALRQGPLADVAALSWKPVRVGLSADGTQGFSTGYQRHELVGGGEKHAKYLSYWCRHSGQWRMIAYRIAGASAGPSTDTRWPDLLPAESRTPQPGRTNDHRVDLSAAEQAFSNRAQAIGLGPAFAEFGRADSINLGGGATADIVRGADAIARFVGANEPGSGSSVYWSADEDTQVASSGDLGVTFGFIRFHQTKEAAQAPAPIPFFTVWARDGAQRPWRYIAE